MKLTLSCVKEKFIDLIESRISRESADRWARSIIQKLETRELEYSPLEDEKKIWDGVMYLYGIDLQESPGDYLHDAEDIKQAFDELFSESERGRG